MAATGNVVPSNPSNRTARRRVLRNAHRDRLQKAMFMVDLQLQGMRSCIAGLFDRQTVLETNPWLTQPHVDCGSCEWWAGGEIPQQECGLKEEADVDDVVSCCEWRAGGEIPQQEFGLKEIGRGSCMGRC